MVGKGIIIRSPKLKLRVLATFLISWQALICVLGIWWAMLLLRQSNHISELESKLGISKEVSELHVERTERMLFWESTTFLILLCGSTALVSILYFRDVKRARSLQAFFASFTHELRTPLTSIRLQAEAIADEMKDSALTKRLLQDAQRLEAQVNRTLELARVEGGGALHLQTIGLSTWIHRWIKNVEHEHRAEVKIMLKNSEHLDSVSVTADPHALEIIFRNILENSMRHSKKNDGIYLLLSAHTSRDYVELAMQDNGLNGAVDSRKLGELFYKGKNSSGAGVGLYLIKTLMQKMGGEAKFEAQQEGFVSTLKLRTGEVHE